MMQRFILSAFVLLSFLFCFPFYTDAQVIDTATVRREVDSLIQVSYDLSNLKKYEEAMQVIEATESRAQAAWGRESVGYSKCLHAKGVIFYSQGKYAEVEPYWLEVNAICEKVLGKEHPNYITSLNNLANMYLEMGDYKKTEIFYLESISIREKISGKEHPDYATGLNNLANLYYTMNNYEKAERLYLEAKAIREKVLGQKHADYAASLGCLANLYWSMGNFVKAEPLFWEAKTIQEKILGREHPTYTSTLLNLANLYRDMSNYEKSEPLYFEVKHIREKVLGKEHPYYANCLNNLAILYCYMGDYEKAEPLYLEALAIRGKTLGKEHPFYAECLNNLAVLYSDMGNYEKSEQLILESLATMGKKLGKEHPYYANCLNNLAVLHRDMGNYTKAEQLYLESLVIQEKLLGKEHSDYAETLMNLAILYQTIGENRKAEHLYYEAKTIFEKVLGKEHPSYALSLGNLANLYSIMGEYEKSEHLHLEANAIFEKVLGKEHPRYASSLGNLANLYVEMGRYEKAELLYLQAKVIWQKVRGKEHPDYATSLDNLAVLYLKMGLFKEPVELYKELAPLNQSLLLKSSSHLSESELNNYAETFSLNQDQLLSFTGIAPTQTVCLPPLAYSNTLFYKGFLLNTANQVKRLALADSVSTEKYYTLKGYRRRLAAQYAQPIADRDSILITDLEEKANTLEKELVRTVAGYGEAMRQVRWQEVQQQLKKSEAAIEFVHYRYYNQKARATDSIMYAALVLLPSDTAPHFIPLCEARQLEAVINQAKQGTALSYQDIYFAHTGGKASLYKTLWAPLEPYLKDVTTIYYAPAGLLHRLNLTAIQPTLRETLGDRLHLVELGSTRSLVVPAGYQAAANDAALFGGIRYEMDSAKIVQANIDLDTDLATRGSSGFVFTDSTLRGGDWKYLPATEKEITTTDQILQKHGFQTSVRHDYAATEEALLSIGQGKTSPRVLHIATHGFFFPDPKDTLKSRQRLSGEEPVFKISDNPMIRSGLLLAGANHAWKTGKPLRPGMEDGILTAYEISQMNLRNTELVVLSACETGLGQIEGNEGVYGLQRAFKIAGAKYLLMSLWQVPDKATQELMQAFYENWLDGGKSIPDAFREAQVKMRAKYPNPFYWAGFVLVE